MGIEERKLRILDFLSQIEDETIIHQIENLLNPRIDFWDNLSEKEKAEIDKGLRQSEKGERMSEEAFLRKVRKSSPSF